MFLYQVVPIKSMPIPVLAYTYPDDIAEGSLVKIPIKNKIYEGIVIKRSVLEDVSGVDSDNKNIKQIKDVLPFCFSKSASLLPLSASIKFSIDSRWSIDN